MKKEEVTKKLEFLLEDINKSIASEMDLVLGNSQRTPEDLIKLYHLKLDVLRILDYSELPLISSCPVDSINDIKECKS